MQIHKPSVLWALAAIVVWLMYGSLPTTFWDTIYYRGLFKLIRVTYDFVLGWSPIAFVYFIVSFLIIRFVIILRSKIQSPVIKLQRILAGFAIVFVVFYVAWGFNYKQRPIHAVLNLPIGEFTQADADKEFIRATQSLFIEANKLPVELTTVESIKHRSFSDHQIRNHVKQALRMVNLPAVGKVRVRKLFPKGTLLRLSTAGIYIPHAFEGHVDPGLMSVQLPFTMAHEMTHGYGITDEGACNFIAWLACSLSEDPWIRVGGALSYWRYASSGVSDSVYAENTKELPPFILSCLKTIHENNKKYPDILPAVRDAIYGKYLQSHGVPGGLKSYQYVVIMVHEYLAKQDQPIDLNNEGRLD